MSRPADDVDASTVGVEDGFDNGETHTGAGNPLPLHASPVELAEDEGLLEFFDALSKILDTDQEAATINAGRDPQRRAWWRVFDCIFDEVTQDSTDEPAIEAHLGHIVRHLHFHGAIP